MLIQYDNTMSQWSVSVGFVDKDDLTSKTEERIIFNFPSKVRALNFASEVIYGVASEIKENEKLKNKEIIYVNMWRKGKQIQK